MRSLQEDFPIWKELNQKEQDSLVGGASFRRVKKGQLLHGGGEECTGLLLVCTGRLRAYILSEEGREVTLYRLLPREMCLFSASCMMQYLTLSPLVEAEKDTDLWILAPEVYHQLMETCAPIASFTNRLMARRFSEVTWLVDQILFKSMDRRLADFLLEESAMEKSGELKMTHEKIAHHLGTAREVISRMLSYFQEEGLVKLSRGTVSLTDKEALRLRGKRSSY